MSEKCPKCNLPEVRHEYTRGGALYRVWACESNEFKRSLACETIAALRTELAAAKQRVAELERGIAKILPDFNCRMFTPYYKLLSDLLPADFIHNIPGKEDHDGEMH